MSWLSNLGKKKLLVAGLALTFGAMVMAGCGGGDKKAAPEKKAEAKDTLIIGLTNAPVSLNPLMTPDASGKFLSRYMYETLLGQPKAYQFSSHLAQSFETKDNQTFTIKLNPKAKWTDGKPITADDVIFTFNLIANPKNENARGRFIKFLPGLNGNGKLEAGNTAIPGLVAKDATTVEFKTKTPLDINYVKALMGFDVPILPKHVFEKLDPAKLSQSEIATNPTVTSGPYKFVKMVAGNNIELVANENFYLGAPKTKRIFIKIQNGTNMVTDLKAGKIHMITGGAVGTVPVKDIDMLKKEPNLVVKHVPAPATQFMEVNYSKPEFNTKFRRALAMAINKKQIVDDLYKGYASVIPSLYTMDSPVFDKELKPIPFDVEAAKKELKESGFDTSRELTLQVPTGNILREQSADIIQQNLKAIGLKVKQQKMDFPSLMSNCRKGNFELLLMGLSQPTDPDYAAYYIPGSSNNFGHVNDPKLTEMFAKGASATSFEARKAVYKDIQKYMRDNQPNIILYGQEHFIVQTKNLVGGIHDYWEGSLDDVHTWELK
ncbi:MAG: ABC transporter substrate-binding protein [Phascolarctobacterium sp.]|nr:ABC transporter substrate-binding protein [Phascolarctobacterium sp.]